MELLKCIEIYDEMYSYFKFTFIHCSCTHFEENNMKLFVSGKAASEDTSLVYS